MTRICSLSVLLVVIPIEAAASLVTLFVEDQGPYYNATPITRAAEQQFLSLLSAFTTDDFESQSRGQTAFTSDFGIATAQFSVSPGGTTPGGIEASFFDGGQNGVGFYTSLAITFSAAVGGFGFYGVDWADAGGNIVMTAVHASGNVTSTSLPVTGGGSSGSPSGSVFFLGLVDSVDPFASITLQNVGRLQDVAHLENMTVGSVRVVEPSTFLLVGLATVVVMARRRFSSSS